MIRYDYSVGYTKDTLEGVARCYGHDKAVFAESH
jgi:hypothetical protein